MLKNISTSITLVIIIGAVIIISAAATASPGEKSEQIGEKESGIGR